MEILTAIISSSIRTATVLLLAALGAMTSEIVGVINIGIEGMMLLGAFAAVLGSYYSGVALVGLVSALAVGALVGFLHGFASITLRANQTISSVAINLAASGLTVFLCITLFGTAATTPPVSAIQPVQIPYLSSFPIVGELLFSQSPFTYLAFVLIPCTSYFLRRTRYGLRMRAVGEHPKAADTAGVNVAAIRYTGVVASGVLSALSGAYLSLSLTNYFNREMTCGRGFIALAAMIMGKRQPKTIALACLLFGFADALQMNLQSLSIPTQLVQSLPYVLTILVLTGAVGGDRAPSALGKPYGSMG